MMMHDLRAENAVRTTAAKRSVSVRWLLEWAFQREKAQLEFPGDGVNVGGFGYISSTAAIIQHEMLGCRVDGGGHSSSHPDADVVADALIAVSRGHEDRRKALWVAELARCGREPDWMRDATPKVEPLETRTTRHGVRSITRDSRELGSQGWPAQPRRNRKQVIVHDAVNYCPVVCRPSVADIAKARRSYLAWWSVLLDLRASLKLYSGLTCFEVTDEMPPRAPWAQRSERKVLTSESLGG